MFLGEVKAHRRDIMSFSLGLSKQKHKDRQAIPSNPSFSRRTGEAGGFLVKIVLIVSHPVIGVLFWARKSYHPKWLRHWHPMENLRNDTPSLYNLLTDDKN